MAEENKGMLDSAKEMLGDKLGNSGELLDKAKEFSAFQQPRQP